jgi:hypothetical protein
MVYIIITYILASLENVMAHGETESEVIEYLHRQKRKQIQQENSF